MPFVQNMVFFSKTLSFQTLCFVNGRFWSAGSYGGGLRGKEISLIKETGSSLLCQEAYIQRRHDYIQTLYNLCGLI